MTKLTAQQVRAFMEFAFTGERVHPSIRLAAAIVDASGDVLESAGEIGAPPLLKDIAECKAKSCVNIGMPTRAIMDLAQKKVTREGRRIHLCGARPRGRSGRPG